MRASAAPPGPREYIFVDTDDEAWQKVDVRQRKEDGSVQVTWNGKASVPRRDACGAGGSATCPPHDSWRWLHRDALASSATSWRRVPAAGVPECTVTLCALCAFNVSRSAACACTVMLVCGVTRVSVCGYRVGREWAVRAFASVHS